MKITIDTKEQTVHVEGEGQSTKVGLYTPEAFEIVSRWWVKVGWAVRYSYSFAWMGRPIIQMPEDLVRIQELIYRVRPDVVVETGIAHGGSLIFYASLFKAMSHGRVIGIDVEIRPQNRAAIEAHELAGLITLVEGSSIEPGLVQSVRKSIKPVEKVLVILDSNHTAEHVAKELEAYAPMVASGSYIVATDGIMRDLHDVPGGRATWTDDNPCTAVRQFLGRHPEFVLEEPPRPFDESKAPGRVTHWPDAYLRRT